MNSTPQTLIFSAVQEQLIGQQLAPRFHAAWPAYRQWYQQAAQPTSADQGRAALQQHMPELLSTYDPLCSQFGADPSAAGFLSLYNPPAFRAGCSQAAWRGEGGPCLIRNYDFPASLCDRLLLHSCWNGTRVIAMSDCLWGVLDGLNEHGLAVSLAYGGRSKRGQGFAITLVLRYILEFCSTIDEAVTVLCRVPVHMPYNITLLDRHGHSRTVAICPGEDAQVLDMGFATNHQLGGALEDFNALADSCIRERFLSSQLAEPRQTLTGIKGRFQQPPLLRRASEWHGWGTLYSSCYAPATGDVTLFWPQGQAMSHSISHFQAMDLEVHSPAFS